jgi:uncharacterized membrane protein YhiD involved in acid resistance
MGDTFNFQDIFKKSVLTLDTFTTVSYYEIIIGLVLAFLVGIFIFYTYKKCFRGVVYSYNYNVSFVIITMITTAIIMTISSNIVLSLGMVGALSIVRFRTAVKDPLDIAYMFWSISAGIAIGAAMYPIALIGSIFFALTLFWLSRKKIRNEVYLLIIQHKDEVSDDVKRVIGHLNFKLKSKSMRRGLVELTIEIRLKDDNTAFMSKLSEIEGVESTSLVNYTGDYAQ